MLKIAHGRKDPNFLENCSAGVGAISIDFIGVVGLGEGGNEGVEESRGRILGGDSVEKSTTHRGTGRGSGIIKRKAGGGEKEGKREETRGKKEKRGGNRGIRKGVKYVYVVDSLIEMGVTRKARWLFTYQPTLRRPMNSPFPRIHPHNDIVPSNKHWRWGKKRGDFQILHMVKKWQRSLLVLVEERQGSLLVVV